MDLNSLFDEIKNEVWALIKVDTPYTPKDFPDSIPVGKDLDVICLKKNFDYICSAAKKISNFKIIRNKNNVRMRDERGGKLHYQIDITYDYISNKFTKEALKRRKKEKNYYILDLKDEITARRFEYKNDPRKKHHLDYVNRYLYSV